MKLVITLLLFGIFSCSSSKEIPQDLSENIETVFYQKWVAGVKGGGSGINFHVVLKKPLVEEYKLEKVHFDSYEESFQKLSETEYIARIINHQNDLILDANPEKEYGNKAQEVKLKPGVAILYFKIKGKEIIKSFQNVKERPMIAFPSRNKEKN
ncbi:MAG: hypothetical protein ACI9FW_001991 [Flavobacterium sp.]|jgi:hypothetical protein